jgi:hypothetical protein
MEINSTSYYRHRNKRRKYLMARQVTAGETITLIAEFFTFNSSGNKVLQDPDNPPIVSIYDPLHDPRDSNTDIALDALIYQEPSTRLERGIYSYSYAVPATQQTNYWFDLWEATVDGISGAAHMQFLVFGDAEVDQTPVLSNNMMVTVELDSTIASTDGQELGSDYAWSFITTFSPSYSDTKLVRAYAGQWVAAVDDATILLLIYEASKEADNITPRYVTKLNPVFLEARKNFTTYSAILKMIELPVNQGGMTKMLGDLLVKREGANFIDMIKRCEENKNKFAKVVNDAGWVGPNESRPPVITSKGIFDPNRRDIGRLWVTPAENEWPVANGKSRNNARRIWRFDNVRQR